jgi:hypothetical protein
MPDRSKVMTQTKRDTIVLQVGGCGRGLTTPSPLNNNIVRKPMIIASDGSEDLWSKIIKEAKAHKGL